MTNLISIVAPCYNEEASLPPFYKEINAVFGTMRGQFDVDFELLFIDDGSRDNTLSIVKSCAKTNPCVKYISFSRNFGKESAILAGLKYATGDYVAVMDVDLQDPPYLLAQMYEIIEQGEFDCVGTCRTTRKGEPPVRSFFARCFYRLINKISRADIVDGARDFRLMTRQMTEAVLDMKEYNRFSKGIFGWVGFKTKWLEYENIERIAGETKWSFWKLFLYSIEGIIAFSTVPLSLASFFGMLCLFISLIFIIIIVVKTLIWGDPVAGYPSMMCVIFFLGGLQLFSIGILGQYLSKTYLETKRRPTYIVKEKSFVEEEKDMQM